MVPRWAQDASVEHVRVLGEDLDTARSLEAYGMDDETPIEIDVLVE